MFELRVVNWTWFLLGIALCWYANSYAMEVPIYDFPLQAYNQDINYYLSKDSADYQQPLLKAEYQQKQLQQFINHYYSSDAQGLSPWSESLVQNLLSKVPDLEQTLLEEFDNQRQDPSNYHFGENYKPHDASWLNKIKTNMNWAEFTATYRPQNRAIIVQNTYARALPDTAPDFFHFSKAGQGFPFDNLQESALWVGTPVYILHRTQDKAWSLVLTPDAYFAWIKTNDLAYVSAPFIEQWQNKAKTGLMAITQTEASVIDNDKHFLFTAYIGTVLPLVEQNEHSKTILVPLKNQSQQAVMATGIVESHAAQLMPVPATKQHIAALIQQLQNRPYGWGGAFFFNDCSQELKSLFTPFGIWLPRNSSQQAQYTSLDLSSQTMDERLKTLSTKGHPLMTIIYIKGHVMLYLGSKHNEQNELIPITYQNIWGLSPASKDRRYVIGQSVLFPLLASYPEHPDAQSSANAGYFKLIHLDELPSKGMSQPQLVNQLTNTVLMQESLP